MKRLKLDDIHDAVIALLNTDRAGDVPEVTKRRLVPGEEVTRPRMAVFLGDETVDRPRNGVSPRLDQVARRRVTIAVQCVGVAEDLALLDASVSPMLAWATEKLGPANLDGLVHHFTELGTSRAAYQTGVHVLIATALYECSYQTSRSDQTR